MPLINCHRANRKPAHQPTKDQDIAAGPKLKCRLADKTSDITETTLGNRSIQLKGQILFNFTASTTRQSLRAAAVAATALTICSGGAHAQDKDPYDGVWLTGSRTLVAFAYSNPRLPQEARDARDQMLFDMGILGRRFQITDSWINFAPILTYDRNINGGNTGRYVKVGQLNFEIVPDDRAKPGVLVGASMNSGLRQHIAPRTALELDLSARFAWSPQHEIAKTSVYASACVNHALSYATFINGCLDASQNVYDRGKSTRVGGSAGVTRSFVTESAFHQVGFNLEQNRYLNGDNDNYNQAIAALTYKVAPGGAIAFFGGLQAGEKIKGRNSMRERVYAGVTKRIFERPVTFNLSATNARGGDVLGPSRELRNERTYSASLSAPVHQKLSVSVSYSKTIARQEFYDDNALGFNADFRW